LFGQTYPEIHISLEGQVIEGYSSDLGLIFLCIVQQQILFGTIFMGFAERFDFV